MSLKHEVNQTIAQKLPAKGNRLKSGTNAAGLHKRPQIEQIANYLNFGQETVRFPDREAKLIRNHPFMTQLDFFDTQEDQERKWEEEKRHHEAERVAEVFDMSTAAVRAMGTQTGRTQTSDSGAQTNRTRTNGKQNPVAGAPDGGSQSTSSSGLAVAEVSIYTHLLIRRLQQ